MALAVNASERRKLGILGFSTLAVLAATLLGACGVDGVTPDCSDPAVCAPSAGGTRDAGVVPEGGGRTDASVTDASGDLDADLSADADTDGG